MSTDQIDLKKNYLTPFNLVVGLILFLGGGGHRPALHQGARRGHQPFR